MPQFRIVGLSRTTLFVSTLFPAWLAAMVLAACIMLQAGLALAVESANDMAGGWRLLRSPNPQGGPDAISVSHTADVTKSDLDLAGMMLKCSEHGPEIAIVVVEPFSPRARPEVTIGASGQEWHFGASVGPPGAQLILPPEAAQLAMGRWQRATELSIQVKSGERSFAGVIPIADLATAFATLLANCPSH
jgi:hypothetical protein